MALEKTYYCFARSGLLYEERRVNRVKHIWPLKLAEWDYLLLKVVSIWSRFTLKGDLHKNDAYEPHRFLE